MLDRPYLVFAFPIAVIIFFAIVGRLLKPHPKLKELLTNVIAILFILAFAIPFTVAGIWAIKEGTGKHDPALFFFSLPFLTVGLAFAAALILGVPAIFKKSRTKLAHPNEPWMWESDWATGVIQSHATSAAIGTWIIAVIWNSIALTSAVMVILQYRKHPDPKTLFVLLFPLVGLAFLFLAIRASAGAIYFGNSTLRLRALPAAIGGALAGTIHVNRALALTARFLSISRVGGWFGAVTAHRKA